MNQAQQYEAEQATVEAVRVKSNKQANVWVDFYPDGSVWGSDWGVIADEDLAAILTQGLGLVIQ